MKKNLKRIMAGTLAATMMLGMSMTAFASEGTDSPAPTSVEFEGEGDFEGHLEKKAVSVTLPTVATGDTTYNYIVDPEGLIAATKGAKYSGADFDASAKGVYFQYEANKWGKDSAKLKAVNKSSVDVDITVTASIVKSKNIIMSETDTFDAADEDRKLYLAVVTGADANQQTAVIKDTSASVSVTAAGKNDNFEVKYADGKYSYVEKSGATGWTETEVWITGACNTGADWSQEGLAEEVSNLTVTWSYTETGDNLVSDGTKDIVLNYTGDNLTTKPTAFTVTPQSISGSSMTAIDSTVIGSSCTIGDKKLVIKADFINSLKNNTKRGKGTYKIKVGAQEAIFTIN